MLKNNEWIRDVFSRPHMKHIPLLESYNCKWFYIKYGRAFFNPKQAAVANPLEFKLFVLGVCYNQRNELRKPD